MCCSTTMCLLKCWHLPSQTAFHLTWSSHKDSRLKVILTAGSVVLLHGCRNSWFTLNKTFLLLSSCVQASLWQSEEGDRENSEGGKHGSPTGHRLLLSASVTVSGSQRDFGQSSTHHCEFMHLKYIVIILSNNFVLSLPENGLKHFVYLLESLYLVKPFLK